LHRNNEHFSTEKISEKEPPPAFRNAYWLLSLPIDAVGLDQTVEQVLTAAREGKRCFLSTPNLNFLVTAQNDRAFQDTILRSDLSVIDGTALLWMGRMLGLPLPERVAGATLFERLRQKRDNRPPLKVYLFGGADGVAADAAAVLNAEQGGVHCVGYASPGFDSVEALSTPPIIEAINASNADFLLVALGAKKGQAWIMHNLLRLKPPVVCHLGAVINFIAGSIRRAPPWVQRVGFEWLYRILQEPALWRRYFDDGRCALHLIGTAILPALYLQLQEESHQTAEAPRIDIVETDRTVSVRIGGAWSAGRLQPFQQALDRYAATPKLLRIEAEGVIRLDTAFIALLMLLRRYRLDCGHQWHLSGLASSFGRLLKVHRALELAEPVHPSLLLGTESAMGQQEPAGKIRTGR
jgi:N-acetylglucosaminyldiphosphoundecaprenol N-acetyl-beta-D-mannosaminyltransferase